MSFFFFKNAKTTAIYTLSLHDALPIWLGGILGGATPEQEEKLGQYGRDLGMAFQIVDRSEERRVGKECRSRWARDDCKKKEGNVVVRRMDVVSVVVRVMD